MTDDECPACGGPLASDRVCADDTCSADDDLEPGSEDTDANNDATPAGDLGEQHVRG